MDDAQAVRAALLRQWQRIEASLVDLDLETPSRVARWRNREVVAHLAVQPSLLARFLRSASQGPAVLSLAASLSGTGSKWLDQATGRAPAAEVFEDLLPLMT